MKELFLIVRREYFSRIKKKSFSVLTILIPFLIGCSLLLPLLLSTVNKSTPIRISIIDSTNQYGYFLQSNDHLIFENIVETSPETNIEAGNGISAVLKIDNDLRIDADAAILYSDQKIPIDVINDINSKLSQAVQYHLINKWILENELDIDLAYELQNKIKNTPEVKLSVVKLDNDTAIDLVSYIGMGLTFLMYFFILMYGTMVLNGVIEEKSNRIVEILISTVSPFNLMLGKILGIGLTGLTQLFIWFTLGFLVLGGVWFIADYLPFGIDSSQFLSIIQILYSINWVDICIFFTLFFIGGYLVYGSLFAMFGASVDNAQDTQQFVMPITTVFIFALYAAIYSITDPQGNFAFWCSVFPFTSPVVMMVRIPFGVPLWQKIFSILILYTTIVFLVKLSAQVYRIGILMYGKKMTVKNIISLMFKKK